MTTRTTQLGKIGESLTVKWLEQHNFSILAQNYRTKVGEIDIIAAKDDLVAFVEVKTRKMKHFPIALTVTFSKQKKIIKTARPFILQNSIINKILRFDIATISFYNKEPALSYISNAFSE